MIRFAVYCTMTKQYGEIPMVKYMKCQAYLILLHAHLRQIHVFFRRTLREMRYFAFIFE